jgi:hypothetical protein
MKKVVNIHNDHHVVRFCKKKLLIRNEDTITGVYPELFHLRPPSKEFSQETTLSALYYEFFDGSPQMKMKACCDAISVSLTPKPKDGLVRLNVGLVKEQGSKRCRPLRVTHEEEDSSPAYSVIRGIPIAPDDELNLLLATVAVIETVAVGTILQNSGDEKSISKT